LENYYIGCYWKDQKEDAEACAGRVLKCLRGLANCDDAFTEVHEVPDRKVPYRIPVDLETIKSIVEKGRNREDFPPYKVIEKLGFNGSFVSNVRKPDDKWSFRFVCGLYANTPGLLNSCVLNLPNQGAVAQRLLASTTMSCMVQTLVSAWDPDWAVVQSSAFRDYFAPKATIPGKALIGWMVYFAARLGKVPDDLPVHSRVELEQGTLLVLSEEPITSERPEHVSTAEALLAVAQRVGLIPA
jgi:hypothetical protein